MIHLIATSDYEWQRVVQRATTNDNEWYNEWQPVVSYRQRVTTNDNNWQQMTTSENNCNEWQRVVFLPNFPFSRIREELTLCTLKRLFKH